MKKLFLTSAALLSVIPSVFATADVSSVVVVKTENGPVRIPASEFNNEQHILHTADDTHDEHGVARNRAGNSPGGPQTNTPIAAGVAPGAPVAGVSAAPIAPPKQFGVLQNKGRFYIVNSADGTPVTDVAGVDPKGYGSNADAWGAMVNLQTTAPATS